MFEGMIPDELSKYTPLVINSVIVASLLTIAAKAWNGEHSKALKMTGALIVCALMLVAAKPAFKWLDRDPFGNSAPTPTPTPTATPSPSPILTSSPTVSRYSAPHPNPQPSTLPSPSPTPEPSPTPLPACTDPPHAFRLPAPQTVQATSSPAPTPVPSPSTPPAKLGRKFEEEDNPARR